MNTNTDRPAVETRPDVHDEVLALLPWRLNGTLDEAEAARVDEHLRTCADCRCELEVDRRLYESIRGDVSSVDHAPQGSFEKLWSRIEEVDRDVPRGPAVSNPHVNADELVGHAISARASTGPQRWLLAASLLLAFGAGLFAASLWNADPPSPTPGARTATTAAPEPPAAATTSPEYRTATSAAPAALAGPTVRAVFDPSTTVEELTRILRETRLTIVAGPSDSGVCTLALEPDGAGSVENALARLRTDPRVRFAELVPSHPPRSTR